MAATPPPAAHPTGFKRVLHALAKVGRAIGHVQAWIILTVFYLIVLAPFALLYKLLADPLHLRRGAGSIWKPKPKPADRWEWAKSQ